MTGVGAGTLIDSDYTTLLAARTNIIGSAPPPGTTDFDLLEINGFAGKGLNAVASALGTLGVGVGQVASLAANGAAGNSAPNGIGIIVGADDSDELEGLILATHDQCRVTIPIGSANEKNSISQTGPSLCFDPGKYYRISRDMPPLAPGTRIIPNGAMIVISAPNIRVIHTTRVVGNSPSYLRPQGDPANPADYIPVYGTDNLNLELPTIHCNGYSGTFIVFDTVSRSIIKPFNVIGATGSSYTLQAGVVLGSRFLSVSPSDYAKVKLCDVLNLGDVDQFGNPETYMAVDKQVINFNATDNTYGKIKLDAPSAQASGTRAVTQHSFPVVGAKLQETSVGRITYQNCDWTGYWGRNKDEITGDGTWISENVTTAYGCNDLRFEEFCESGCKYGSVFGPWSLDNTLAYASQQFNTAGSMLFIKCINLTAEHLRFESADPTLSAFPFIAVKTGSRFVCEAITWNTDGVGRYVLGQGNDAVVEVGSLQVSAGSMPVMPDGTYAPYLKPSNTGFLTVRGIINVNGPGDYVNNPTKWCTMGNGSLFPFGFAGVQDESLNRATARNGGEDIHIAQTTSTIVFGARLPGDAYDRFAITPGGILTGNGSVAPTA